jgi:hypothetical protein
MTQFTGLETTALRAIFSETPELAEALERQFEVAVVLKRENTGGGFFTTISVAGDAPAIICTSVLGHTTQARISGLKHGFGFVLFLKAGSLHLLEGFARAAESTRELDLSVVRFEIYSEPVQRTE